jgi:hypothetical protein
MYLEGILMGRLFGSGKWIGLTGICLLSGLGALAQPDNRAFEERYRLPDSVRFGVQAHAFSFFRNLEYFTPSADGKTLFGQQLSVRGLLRPNPNLTLSGGLYLWKDFGNNTLQAVRPVFTLRYQQNHFAFLFGTLEGQLSHRQIEPLQDFESVITHRQEEGFQFTYNAPKLWADMWLDWQNMIYRNSPLQEQLQFGLHFRPTLVEQGRSRLVGVIQARAHHQGGQLDTSLSKAPPTTFWALSPGLRYEFQANERHSFLVDAYHVKSAAFTSTYPSAIRSGIGLYANAQWKNPWLSVMASYWHGTGVYVRGGGAMYSSLAQEVRSQAHGILLHTRSILILRLMRDFDLGSGCILSLRAEPQYDFLLAQIDYNYQLYINFQPKWGWK